MAVIVAAIEGGEFVPPEDEVYVLCGLLAAEKPL